MSRRAGVEAIRTRGWLAAHKWLLIRRASQLMVFALFWSGPLLGLWIARGNLASSTLFGVIPLSDPFIQLQSWVAGHPLAQDALLGTSLVTLFYMLVGGRLFCSWVCPLNVVSDFAGWSRRRLGLRGGWRPKRHTRYLVLLMVLGLALGTGQLAWELVNPVSMVQRGLIFGFGFAWMAVAALFLWELLVSPQGWCGRLCPHGALFSLLGRWAPLRIHTPTREKCDDCMDCYQVCPEPQVIKPALKGGDATVPRIGEINCTNCGRCIDVCPQSIFTFGIKIKPSETS
ncbi:periplasmic nitrate reductase subunit NapH [Magnetococcus marinus MC-1]|uniref:Periplasmic nitrate reductase subunit NapH n=1 Tax=Magnetococcus marinus (strain ATCC BAA-1437 / JCM 17883 / MC-1) TaxID=156889 RepID=A0L805_MAGMM|nr:quinol dehydrogenase ferredoxin subunit NapH [Magnetococcus marinus]ABK44098.1 periplasmic nitrate reductase subunit NapH [Magnetococcus marinus MC-1]